MTFSIAARVASGWIVGTATYPTNTGITVHHGKPGQGVVLTQSYSAFSEIAAEAGFSALKTATTSHEALEMLRDKHVSEGDKTWNSGQIVLLSDKISAAYTGPGCIGHARHIVRPDVVVAANIMRNKGVPEAMLKVWDAGALLDPRARIMAALRAGEAAGGDIRGHHSAALMFVSDDPAIPVTVCRVNFSRRDPIGELESLQPVAVDHPAAAEARVMLDVETKVNEFHDNGNYAAAASIARIFAEDPDYPFNEYLKELLHRSLLADSRNVEAQKVEGEFSENYRDFISRKVAAENRVEKLTECAPIADVGLALSAIGTS